MPKLHEEDGYTFRFFSSDRAEPPHVHVDSDGRQRRSKFWLNPVELCGRSDHKPHELTEIERIIRQQRDVFLRKWYEYFGP